MSYEIPLQGQDILNYNIEKVQESFRRHAQMAWGEAEAVEERMNDPTLDAMWGRKRKSDAGRKRRVY